MPAQCGDNLGARTENIPWLFAMPAQSAKAVLAKLIKARSHDRPILGDLLACDDRGCASARFDLLARGALYGSRVSYVLVYYGTSEHVRVLYPAVIADREILATEASEQQQLTRMKRAFIFWSI